MLFSAHKACGHRLLGTGAYFLIWMVGVIPGDAGHRILVGEADHYFDSNFGTAAFQIKHLRVTFSRTVFGGGNGTFSDSFLAKSDTPLTKSDSLSKC